MTEFDPIGFLERAVATPSHDTVDKMRQLLVETLKDAGIEPRVDDAGNTLATRGTGTPHIVLNTHIDTVVPHVPTERDGAVLRGRGACDAKGPLAALLDAFLDVDPTTGDGTGRLTLAVTPDEEERSLGAAALEIERGLPGAPESAEEPAPPDAVIVGEPTDLDVCHAARGRFQGTVRIEGESAHAAEPAAGSNAITGLEAVLGAIDRFDDEHGPHPHPDLGSSLLTPTVLEGGSATNQLAAEASLVLDRRSVPPETAGEFEASLEAHLQAAVADDFDVSFSLTDRESPFLEAFATDRDAAVVSALAEASDGTVRPFDAAAEASYFAAHAPTVVFGPGVLADEDGPVAHADREYVRLPRVEQAGTVLATAIAALLE